MRATQHACKVPCADRQQPWVSPHPQNVDDPVSDPLEVSRQRMFFGGRELRDKYTLAACGLKKNYVAQVTGKPTEAEQKAFIERYS